MPPKMIDNHFTNSFQQKQRTMRKTRPTLGQHFPVLAVSNQLHMKVKVKQIHMHMQRVIYTRNAFKCRLVRAEGETYKSGYMFYIHKANKRQAGAKTATPVVNADTAQTTIPI